MNAALNSTRRALRLGTGLATCVSCIVFAQSAFGQVVLPAAANPPMAGDGISTAGNVMTVDAQGGRAIDWHSFSVGAGGTVDFVSPGTNAALTVVNRVIGTPNGAGMPRTFTPSEINGTITSAPNIALWLVNPSGITFGPTGSFNGGSLVLSTLAFRNPNLTLLLDPSAAQDITMQSLDVSGAPVPVELKLEGGTQTQRDTHKIVSSGSVLLLGEQISVGKTVEADNALAGDVFIVAASKAVIKTQTGSPLNFTITRGTRLSGVDILGTGSVKGQKIVLAATRGTSTIQTLLQVQAGAELSASKTGSGIELITRADTTAAPAVGNGILSNGILTTTGTGSDVKIVSNTGALVNRVTSSGDVSIRTGADAAHTMTVGAVQAGGDINLASVGAMTLGTGGNQNIFAGGKVTINSGATIDRGGALGDTLSIGSFRNSALASGAMSIVSALDMNLGNASLTAGPLGTAALSLTSTEGSITLGTAVANRFTASAFGNFTANGAITVNEAAGASPGVALSISAGNSTGLNTTAGDINLVSARTTGPGQDISIKSSGTSGDIQATTITADRNLTITSTVGTGSSIGSNTGLTLTSQNGSITASAASINLASATAGKSITLRSNGAIAVTGGLTSGDNLPLGNITVAGLPNGAAASFTAPNVNAKTGAVSITAARQTIGRVISAQATTLTGTELISLGSATVGGNLTVTTDGDILLGTAPVQTIGAEGRVAITSTGGAIGRGAGSGALTLMSNSENASITNALTIKARNAVNLGNATLRGGSQTSAPISVKSETSNIILDSARGTSFTGVAGTTFAATGAISANSMLATAGNTIAITAPDGIQLSTVLTGGTGENIVLTTSDGPVSATSIVAQKNLTIASRTSPASSITADSLRAIDGSLNAFARSMTLGTVRAGTSITLRADNAIVINDLIRAETNLTVAGLNSAGADLFDATSVTAATGIIDVKADATDIDTLVSGTNTLIEGETATLGSVSVGRTATAGGPLGNLLVKTSGTTTLGKLPDQSVSAKGSITIDSGGDIRQGTGATGLTITANDDGMGANALTLKAAAAIVLGDATLNGGVANGLAATKSAINLTSGTSTLIGQANGAAFTANAGSTFQAIGPIVATEAASITARGAVTLNDVTAAGTARDVTITTDGAITAAKLKASGDVTIGGGATSFTATTVEATNGSIGIVAGATNIGTSIAGTNISISGATANLGAIKAGKSPAAGNVSIKTTGDVTLGQLADQRQSATGAFTVESATGSIAQGAAGLILTANSDGIGAEALTLKAGAAIALGDATLNGGLAKGSPAEKSDIRLTSRTTTTIGEANAAEFAANSTGIFTANGAIVAAENVSITGKSGVVLNTVTASGVNRDIVITTPGAITAGTLKAARNVTVDGGATAFRATNVEATAGSIDVKARATDIASATSGLNTRISGSTAELGTVIAGTTSQTGSLTVQTTNDITLGKLANQTLTASGGILIESTAGSIKQGAGLSGLRLTSNSNGAGSEALTLKAKGAIALGGFTLSGGRAQQSDVSLTSGGSTTIANASGSRVTMTSGADLTASGAISAASAVALESDRDTTIGSASGSNVTAIAGGAFIANRSINATNNVALTATGAITTKDSVTAGNAVKLSSADATIEDVVSAKTIDVTNTSKNKLVIGGEPETRSAKADSPKTQFTLDRLEAGRLIATDTLTLGADGSDDVELKQVDLSAPKTVRVLANGKRIDVTGKVSFDSNTTLKLGGDVATGTNQASIIQIASDSGGQISGADGRLELGAVNIVAGNKALIDTIADADSFETAVAVATNLNRAAGSVLYNGNADQAVLIRAGTMKINFNGFALFQNTGSSSLSQGVSLGAQGSPAVALELVNNRPTPVFALFGSINEVKNNATALLGNPPLARYDQVALSRLNGCVIGGGNCLSVQNLTPSLTAVDTIRNSIFTVKPDFQVPFDPLVGTNNDALFDDVGSTGLGELPMTPIECSGPGGTCSTQKKDGM